MAFAKPFMTVEGLYMSRFSTRKAKAMALVRFLASQAEANARKVATGDLVTRTDTGAALTESMRVFEAQLKHAQPTPNVPMMKSLWSPLNRVLLEVLKREVSLKTQFEKHVCSSSGGEGALKSVTAGVLIAIMSICSIGVGYVLTALKMSLKEQLRRYPKSVQLLDFHQH